MSNVDVFTLTLASLPGSVREARAAVVGWARGVDANCVVEIVALLVSELATNAVKHAQTAYTMTASWSPPLFRVEITDSAAPIRWTPRQPDQVGGWGFELVEKMSHAWGIDERSEGKTVWFDVERPTPACG